MSHTRPLVIITWLLAAGWAAAQADNLPCMKLDVKSAQEPKVQNGKGFSATKSIDLTLMLYFKKKVERDSVAELRFTTPDGFLYRSMAVPIPAAGRVPGRRHVPGYPNPVPEQAVISERTATGIQDRVEIPFPIAGTDIVSSGLYGTWKVEAFAAGTRTPCTQALTFRLDP